VKRYAPPVEVSFEERRALAWALCMLPPEDPRHALLSQLHERLWKAHDGFDVHPSKCAHERIVEVIGDPKSPTAHVCECGHTIKFGPL
jgi:hypothetical protein